jgi:hypothetical protein
MIIFHRVQYLCSLPISLSCERDWKDLTGGLRVHKDDIMQIGHVDL